MSVATAKVIAKSKHFSTGTEITTFEIEFPRIILAEFNTHRMISKNTSSSRAIPATSIIQLLDENPFIPEYWGKNQSGMQAKEELNPTLQQKAKEIWLKVLGNVSHFTEALQSTGLHKQLTNRISEPFQRVKMVATATEWNNFYWLRDHDAAQPEMQALAQAMWQATQKAETVMLFPGDWHLPYYMDGYWKQEQDGMDGFGNTLNWARKISVSCCAQTSYRKNDDTIEKAERLFKTFFEAERVHASPAEHQATPINYELDYLPHGVTHQTFDDEGTLWSNNFKHWIQYRALIPNNVKPG